jgi:hypothetical protein
MSWWKIVAGGALIGLAFVPGLQGVAFAGIKLLTLTTSLGVSLSLGGVAQALSKPQSGSRLNDPRGRVQTIKQSASPKPVGYGLIRVGGIYTYANATGTRTRPTDQVQLVITLFGHAIDSFEGIKFDDQVPELSNGAYGSGVGAYTGKAFVQINYGYDGQEAFPSLITESAGLWTSEHRQRGCAGAYVRLNFDEKLYPNGIPNITFIVRGKLVFDPRSDDALDIEDISDTSPSGGQIVIQVTGHGFVGGEIVRIPRAPGFRAAEGTWGIDFIDADHFSLQGSTGTGTYTGGAQAFRLRYSNNAALCIADYLMDPWVGMGVAWAKIRESVLIAAANVCDEAVTTVESPATTENRYTINGSFETSETPGEILAQMANAMAGHVTYIGGEWHIIPGAFRLPVLELTDDDVIAPMNVQSKRSRRDLFNGVKGTFASVDHDFIETDFPAVTDDTYLEEDQGQRIWKDIFLPFTILSTTAQRIARIELNRNRRQIAVEMTCNMRAYELQPGDVVEFTHARYGWEVETFEVEECGLQIIEDAQGNPVMAVRLRLVQTDVDVYGFAVDEYGNTIDPSLLSLLLRKLPFGWTPGLAPDLARSGDDLFPFSDYRFNIAQFYRLAADGTLAARLRIGGFIPVNVFSQNLTRPRTRTLAASYSDTGGFLKGGTRYYLAVTAIEMAGSPEEEYRQTALSEIAFVDVPASSPDTTSNSVTISGLRWHPSTTNWRGYFGTDPFRLSRQPGGSIDFEGPSAQPTSITFKGVNAPANLPSGYFHHLGGAPDQRFDRIRVKMFRSIHGGIWGGQVVTVQAVDSPVTQYSITLNPTVPFTVNALAGRHITLVGVRQSAFGFTEDFGMFRSNFLIESNTADTVVLAASSAGNPVDLGYVTGSVVVVRTKVTEVGEDENGVYLADTGFGEGGQELGDADPNIGGGIDSLRGAILRIIAGTGAGGKYVIKGNTSGLSEDSPPVALDRIFIVGDWDTTPDETSVFIITDANPSLQYDTDKMTATAIDDAAHIFVDVPKNLIGEQYVVYAIALSETEREAPEESSPFREIYLYGEADEGRLIDADATLTVYDRYVRVNTDGGPVTVTMLDPSEFPGIEVVVHNVGSSGNDATLMPSGSPAAFTIAGETSVSLADNESRLFRGFNDGA